MMCGLGAMALALAEPAVDGPGTKEDESRPISPTTLLESEGGEALSGKISDELLVCKICYVRYCSAGRLPKLLSCSHTFCEACMRHYHDTSSKSGQESGAGTPTGQVGNARISPPTPVNTTDNDHFPCPLCRKLTPLPDGGIENLSNNFTVLSLMEIIERQSSSSSSSAASPIKSPKRLSPRKTSSPSPSSPTSAFKSANTPDSSKLMTPGVSNSGAIYGTNSFVAEKCVVCDKRFPESQFPCGHCICVQCSGVLTNGVEEKNCPKCAKDVEETAAAAAGSHKVGVARWSAADLHVAERDKDAIVQSAPHLPDTRSHPSDTQSASISSERLQYSPPVFGANDITPVRERPPPYNPHYVDNPLYGNAAEIRRGSTNTSPSRSLPRLPTTREPMRVRESIQRTHLVQSPNRGSTLPHLSPKHLSNSTASDTVLYRNKNRNECQSSPDQRGSNYELTNHSYESPYSLRRSQSLRRPPIPPRRQSSSPGFFATLRLRKRSTSCPVQSGDKKVEVVSPSQSEVYVSPSQLYGVAPPVPPRRRLYESPQSSPIRCVKKFGKYSENRMQTSTFRQPTKIAISDKGDIVVVDVQNMTVQVFTMAGDYLSMFKVIGVQGASFFSPDRLAIATHRGVDIYTMAGERLKELTTGLTVNTAAYKFGFLACSPRSVLIYRQSLVFVKEINRRKNPRPKLFRRTSGSFENIKDIAVTTSKHIAILDSVKNAIYIIDENGVIHATIDPSRESCGMLRQPESLTIDRSNNIFIADTGNQRVLKFANNGAYSKCILNCRATSADRHLAPHGVAATDQGHLVVAISGDHVAEIRIYQLS